MNFYEPLLRRKKILRYRSPDILNGTGDDAGRKILFCCLNETSRCTRSHRMPRS